MSERERVFQELRRLGYEPSEEQFASSVDELKRRSAQYRLRDKAEIPRSMDEIEWAVVEALVIQGGIHAWPGDGVGCVAQMIWAQHERAASKDDEIARLRGVVERMTAALKPFAEAAWDELPDENDAVPVGLKRGTYTLTAGDVRRARTAYQQLPLDSK